MKVGLVSLGCPKNLVDSEVMLGLARSAGHTLTADAAEADVLVVNTCSFIEPAREESVSAILEMAAHKAGGRCRRLIVTGCLAERYRDELRAEIPEIDVVLGTGEIPRILEAVAPAPGPDGRAVAPGGRSRAATPGRRPSGTATAPPGHLCTSRTPRVLTTPPHLAYVKIAEGCNYRCAFCVIPRLRGPYRSRPAGSVVREAQQLADRGVKELILVSQDSTRFGADRGERGALARLLRRLNRVDGLEWIRVLYLYPATLTADTLEAVAECDKVCKYVDLPLQHAADTVLRRMRRPGTRAGYERLIERVRSTIPGVALRSTFIVGFPGETDEEFGELLQFVERAGFDHLGVFAYSHEEGTAAWRMHDDVPRAVKRARLGALMMAQRRLVRSANRRRIGERVEVMVDGPTAEHPLVIGGRLASQAPEIDPVVYLTEADPRRCRPGTVIEGEIVAAQGYDLVVRPLPGGKSA